LLAVAFVALAASFVVAWPFAFVVSVLLAPVC
jgi:hypothetical protein